MEIEELIKTWKDQPGGAERSNFPVFIDHLVSALNFPKPTLGAKGELREYQYEGPVRGGSNRTAGGHGSIDLYRRAHFVLEAKQSHRRYEDASGTGVDGGRYDRLMARARAQAKDYAVNLPADHPTVPFLLVCDIGRAFKLYYDFAGNGRRTLLRLCRQRPRLRLLPRPQELPDRDRAPGPSDKCRNFERIQTTLAYAAYLVPRVQGTT